MPLSKPFTKELLSPFLASLSKLTVLLLYPFNRNHYRSFDIEHRSPNRRRWRRAKDSPHVSTFKMAPYRSRIPFRPGCKLRGSSPRSRRALPRFHPSRALPRPPIKRLSTAAPLREETARAFIPTPCVSPRAVPHALHVRP